MTSRFPMAVGSLTSAINHAAVPSMAKFPVGVNVHWEIENRAVWNERDHTNEEHELTYEVSWIAELGVWRRFLRACRKVKE